MRVFWPYVGVFAVVNGVRGNNFNTSLNDSDRHRSNTISSRRIKWSKPPQRRKSPSWYVLNIKCRITTCSRLKSNALGHTTTTLFSNVECYIAYWTLPGSSKIRQKHSELVMGYDFVDRFTSDGGLFSIHTRRPCALYPTCEVTRDSPLLWGFCVAAGHVRWAHHIWLFWQLYVNQNVTMIGLGMFVYIYMYIYGRPRASLNDTTLPKYALFQKGGTTTVGRNQSFTVAIYQPSPSHCCSHSGRTSSKRTYSFSSEPGASLEVVVGPNSLKNTCVCVRGGATWTAQHWTFILLKGFNSLSHEHG